MSSGEDAGADFFNIWAEGSDKSPIPKKLLKVIKESAIKDPRIESGVHGYITRWYVTEHELMTKYMNRKLIMGLDTSDAIGRDDIGMIIRDVETGAVIATGIYNETNTILFAEWLMSWIEKYPNLIMVIERKSSGVSIIDNLLLLMCEKGINPFKRLFNWIVSDVEEKNKTRNIEILKTMERNLDYSNVGEYRKYFGYATAGSGKASRDNLYGAVFNNSIKYTGDTVRDSTLINQLESLTIKNNRIDHRAGGHDDLVIGWLLSYWFLTEAKNKKYYEINTNRILTTVVDAMIAEQGGKKMIEYKDKQIKMREEIDDLFEKLKKENNPAMNMIIINKIKMIYRRLDKNIIQPFNIESVIENIELEKYKQKRYYGGRQA